MLNCPACNKPTISPQQKMSLGPAGQTTCKGCGADVSVPWSAVLVLTPLIVAVALSATVLESPVAIAGSLALSLVTLFWLWKFVPLINRQS